MMKQLFVCLFILTVVLAFYIEANADLIVRGMGTSAEGTYQLIYDTDLNITWYDYTKSLANWQIQMNWADTLTVNFGVTIYDDWRLPATVDGPYLLGYDGYDGTTAGGYNITSSEMGHLFYTELGNKAYYDKSGNPTGCSLTSTVCFTSKGDFQNLQAHYYWSGTEHAANTYLAWGFSTYVGGQYTYSKDVDGYYAIAVREGDVTVVPEPISSILFVAGGATLIGRKYIRRKKKEV